MTLLRYRLVPTAALAFTSPLIRPRPPARSVPKLHVTLDQFHTWADENQIVRDVEVSVQGDIGGGRGLVATCDLQPGEVAVQVPRKLTISHHGEAENNDWCGTLAARLCDLHKEVAAEEGDVEATTISFGDGTSSYTWKPFSWRPYLEYGLPTEAPYLPCDWTESELAELQDEQLVQYARDLGHWRQWQYQRFASRYGREDFMRALSLVQSRVLEIDADSRMLVPFVDIANHITKEEGAGSHQVGSSTVVLVAGSKGVKKGQPLCINYGEKKSAEECVLHYGFVPPCNDGQIEVSTIVGGFNEEVIPISWSNCTDEGHPDPKIQRVCADELESCPTTLEQDVYLLEAYKGGFDAYRVALDFRIVRKTLLKRAVGSLLR